MQPSPQASIAPVLPLLVQAGIGIIVILLSWGITTSLPMVTAIGLPLPFSTVDLLGAVMKTGIIVITVLFGIRMETMMPHVTISFPRLGLVIKLISYLIVTVIAYTAYSPLLLPYLGNYTWTCSVFFLVLFLFLLGHLSFVVYSQAGAIGALISRLATGSKEQECTGCGCDSPPDARFCRQCGLEFAAARAPATKPLVSCPHCRVAISSDDSFCPDCGGSLIEGDKPAAGEEA